MKASEIRQHSSEEIKDLLKEQEALLANLKYNHALSPIENPARITAIRKTVARFKTLLHEKEHGLGLNAKPRTRAEKRKQIELGVKRQPLKVRIAAANRVAAKAAQKAADVKQAEHKAAAADRRASAPKAEKPASAKKPAAKAVAAKTPAKKNSTK